MESDEWDGKDAPVGWTLGERMAREAIRSVIVNGITPVNVGKSMANGLAGVRKATAVLPPFVQELLSHALDKLDVLAADPATEAAVADWLKGMALPLLDPG